MDYPRLLELRAGGHKLRGELFDKRELEQDDFVELYKGSLLTSILTELQYMNDNSFTTERSTRD